MYGRQVCRNAGHARPSITWESYCKNARQFHTSFGRSQDDANSSFSPPRSQNQTRRSASAAASREIQSLKPATGGIDLRNLDSNAAQGRPLVRRQIIDGPASVRQPRSAATSSSTPVLTRLQHRGRLRGGHGVHRGGARGRGGFRGRGGRDADGPRTSRPRRDDDEGAYGRRNEEEDKLTEEDVMEQDIENEDELQAFSVLKATLDHVRAMESEVIRLQESDPENEKAQEYQQKIEEQLKMALNFLAHAKQEFVQPRHEPQEISRPHALGAVGDVPVGQAGLGRTIEEGLRLIGERPDQTWRDPRELAKRLVAGELVKFTNNPERREVLYHAERIEYDKTEPNTEHVGFAPLAETEQREIVERLVRGDYELPSDKALKGPILPNIARITGGNSTYLAADKTRLIGKIRSLLPMEMQGERRKEKHK